MGQSCTGGKSGSARSEKYKNSGTDEKVETKTPTQDDHQQLGVNQINEEKQNSENKTLVNPINKNAAEKQPNELNQNLKPANQTQQQTNEVTNNRINSSNSQVSYPKPKYYTAYKESSNKPEKKPEKKPQKKWKNYPRY